MIVVSHGDWECRVILSPDRRLARPVTDDLEGDVNMREKNLVWSVSKVNPSRSITPLRGELSYMY
jgi:hypothetical protein